MSLNCHAFISPHPSQIGGIRPKIISQPSRTTSSRRPRIHPLITPSLSLSPSIPKTDEAKKSSVLSDWLQENDMYLSPLATWGRPKHPLAIANETSEDGESSGRGLVAVKSIIQGEPIFEVPFELVITKEAAQKAIPSLPENVDEYIAIAIFLIQQRQKGEDSFWKPYLDILPPDEELIPLFRWDDEDLQLLKGSPTLTAAESLNQKLHREFEECNQSIFAKNRQLFSEEVYNYAAWEWAFAVLFSRAIMLTSAQQIALVPYADLLNHNPFCSTFIDFHTKPFSDEKVIAYYTDRPYNQMDQVFVTYGPKSNGDLLLLYGFVTDRNPYDSVDLVVSLDKDDPMYDRKAEYLKSCGVEEYTSFPLYRDRYPMELIEYLRFCVASEEEYKSNPDFGDFVNENNETLVARAIIDGCQNALKGYPQTREEDDKLINDSSLFRMFTQKQRWAVRQRRAEKRILERTIANIEQEMTDPTFMFVDTSGN